MSTSALTVVTGAAGGIGRATAEALAAIDRRVVLVDRDRAGLDEAARAIGPAVVDTVPLDVADQRAVAGLAAAIAGLGDLDGLVNAAGVVQMGTVADVDEAAWDRVVDVNLKGTYLVCRALLPELSHPGAAIVNVASISGRTKGFYTAPNYVASKAGVIGLTMSLAAQHAATGLRVNCVAPGLIDTPMLHVYTDEQRARSVESVPMGRMGTAAEVAAGIVFLLSAQAGYITGQTLNINGGAFMQ